MISLFIACGFSFHFWFSRNDKLYNRRYPSWYNSFESVVISLSSLEFVKSLWPSSKHWSRIIESSHLSHKTGSGSVTSVENKRFAKVRRENLIVKQKGMNLSVIGF